MGVREDPHPSPPRAGGSKGAYPTPGRPFQDPGLKFGDEAGETYVTGVLEGTGSCPKLPQ